MIERGRLRKSPNAVTLSFFLAPLVAASGHLNYLSYPFRRTSPALAFFPTPLLFRLRTFSLIFSFLVFHPYTYVFVPALSLHPDFKNPTFIVAQSGNAKHPGKPSSLLNINQSIIIIFFFYLFLSLCTHTHTHYVKRMDKLTCARNQATQWFSPTRPRYAKHLVS